MAHPGLFDAELSKTGLFSSELNKGGLFAPEFITLAAPPAFTIFVIDDDHDWNKYFATNIRSPLDDELAPQPFFPVMAFDEYDWNKNFELRYAPQTTEETLGALPIIPGLAYAEDLSRSADIRFTASDDDPWHTFFSIPVPPPNLGWDDWDWSRDYSTAYAKPPEPEPFDFTRPIVTPLAYDESAAFFPRSSGSLAAMVVLDEFVNAPAGSIPFGPAPSGRSVRFGFSISAFR